MEKLQNIEISSVHREIIWQQSITHRNSLIWREERSKRITASFFFKIRRSGETASVKIVKEIMDQPILNSIETNHGIENEKFGLFSGQT